ncbi:MAG: ABC transporter ATP-binding protein [Bryobacterales bacterium]|nr:ABC transporter ATP-binding protein [Bryobacteraceae bacterium]MDW8130937.1 ABC transporter ATP-binding protein [Bryobacterales bacterium]
MDGDPAIETAGLTRVYRKRWRGGEIRAVDSVTLTVARGTSFGLLGPNGAGKTTFVKMLLGIVRPTAGSAKLLGMDCRRPEARLSVGYLPENHRLPSYWTGAGLLDFAGALSGMDPRSRQRRIAELLELVGLSEWADVRLARYSKGMLQRLGLAQALMHGPALLLLDEPTDGVDPVGRQQIRGILRELEQRGVTVFLNSHLLSEVELSCREVAIMHRGRIVLAGRVKDLTAGQGYRMTAAQVSERLFDELRRRAATAAMQDGLAEFLFPSREELNRAVDLVRAHGGWLESVNRTTSTLEEVFMRTVRSEAAGQN